MDDRVVMMVSAMYENGGNTTHRLFDGHPQLHVYPFESQLGTAAVSDYLSSFVPFRYRYPEFAMHGSAGDDYEAFYDEELKTLLRAPGRSKFSACGLEMDEADRSAGFARFMEGWPRTRANLVRAFFASTFDAWRNLSTSGRETAYLGYSPVIAFDSDKLLADFADGHVIHVVRNPWSAYADTKKRPFPISLDRYAWTWNHCQHTSLVFRDRYPDRFHIVRYEDIVGDTRGTLGRLASDLGLEWSETLTYPSFNGARLERVFPWGTIVTPTPAANAATADELTAAETREIAVRTRPMREALGYGDVESLAAAA
jgi:Sulfotransferase family